MKSKATKNDDVQTPLNKVVTETISNITHFRQRSQTNVFLKWLIFTIQLILCSILGLPLAPPLAIIFLFIGISRLLVWIHIQIFYKGKRFIASSSDSFWAHQVYASSSVVPLLIIMEGNCDIKIIKDRYRKSCNSPLLQGKMSQRLLNVLGVAVWENVDNFNIDDQVRVMDNDKEESKTWTENDIMDYMGTLQDHPLPQEFPPWEYIILPKVKYGQDQQISHYACIFRLHHSIMDGVSSALGFREEMADKPFEFTVNPLESENNKKNWFFEGVLSILINTVAFLSIPRIGFLKQMANLDNQYNRWCLSGKSLEGPKHFLWSRRIKLETLKKIHKTYKTGLTTVFLSCLGAGYRKALLFKANLEGTHLPEFYHALVPVAMLPYPDKHPRNRYSIAVLPVCVGDHRNDVVSRLSANHKELVGINLERLDILGSFLIMKIVGLMPGFLRKYFIGSYYCKMGFSNVPMAAEEIMVFGGDRIKEFGAWMPCKYTLGLTVVIYSYAGKCRAFVQGDNAYVSKSDVEAIMRHFEDEVVELGRSIGIAENDILC